MIEKKKLKEQIAVHHYKRPVPPSVALPLNGGTGGGERMSSATQWGRHSDAGGGEASLPGRGVSPHSSFSDAPPAAASAPWNPSDSGVPKKPASERAGVPQESRLVGIRRERVAIMGPDKRRRNVTKPDTVQPEAWAEYAHRRDQRHHIHTRRPQTPPKLVRRRLSQTGPLRPVRRTQPLYRGSPVPARSRRNRPRRGLIWKVLGFFTVLVVGLVAANSVLTSAAFRVQQVSVVGTDNRDLVDRLQHMGMQGQSMFMVDVAALTARIEMIPLVASASVEKQWPNLLVITVVERIPVLLWQRGHETYSVDTHGVVIAPLSETRGADHLMTVIDVRSQSNPIHPGVRLNEVDIAFAVEIFERLPKVTGVIDFKLRYDDTIGQTAPEGNGSFIVVEKPDGWLAYLGGMDDANPLDNRLIELQQILMLAQRKHLNLATIDLRFGLRPVYTLKS